MIKLTAQKRRLNLEDSLSDTNNVATNGHSPAFNAYMKNFYNTKPVEYKHSRLKIATATFASILAGGSALVGYYIINGLMQGTTLYSPGVPLLIMFEVLMPLFGVLGAKAVYSYESSLER